MTADGVLCHSFLTGFSQPAHRFLTGFSQPAHKFLTGFSQPAHRFLTGFSQPAHRFLRGFSQKYFVYSTRVIPRPGGHKFREYLSPKSKQVGTCSSHVPAKSLKTLA